MKQCESTLSQLAGPRWFSGLGTIAAVAAVIVVIIIVMIIVAIIVYYWGMLHHVSRQLPPTTDMIGKRVPTDSLSYPIYIEIYMLKLYNVLFIYRLLIYMIISQVK